jgi:hypothetical protein
MKKEEGDIVHWMVTHFINLTLIIFLGRIGKGWAGRQNRNYVHIYTKGVEQVEY